MTREKKVGAAVSKTNWNGRKANLRGKPETFPEFIQNKNGNLGYYIAITCTTSACTNRASDKITSSTCNLQQPTTAVFMRIEFQRNKSTNSRTPCNLVPRASFVLLLKINQNGIKTEFFERDVSYFQFINFSAVDHLLFIPTRSIWIFTQHKTNAYCLL